MSDGGTDDRQRNREIARNEEKRQTVGAIRVSGWAVVFAIIIAAIAVAIALAWLNRESAEA
jgi:hypothetical protein